MARDWGIPPWEIEKEKETLWNIWVWKERYKLSAPIFRHKRQKELAEVFGAKEE